jgi:hypothetical protein
MSWVAVAIGGSALVGAGASIYAADKNRVTPGAPIDPNVVGTNALNTQANLAPTVLGLEQQYRPQYTDLANQGLFQALMGTSSFDAVGALAAMSPAQRADIEAEAARTGRTAAQWLTDHVAEQAANDPVAQSLQQGYTSRSGGMLDLYGQAIPRINELQNQANTATRTSTVNDAVGLAPKLTEAFNAANPGRTAANNMLSSSIQGMNLQGSYNPISAGNLGLAALASTTNAQAYTANPYTANGGPLLGVLEADAQKSLNTYSPIQAQLNAQASSLLASGGALSPDEIRAIQQGSRGAAAARGIYDSNASIASEAMNTASAQRARQLQNMQIAQGIDATGQQQINDSRTYAQGVQSQGQNLSTYNTGQLNQVGMFNAGNQTNVSLANAQAANQAALANAAAHNQYGLAQYGTNANMAQFNAGMQQSYLQNDRNFALQGANQLNAGAYDPMAAIMGTGSNAIGQAGGIVNQGGVSSNTGPQLFDPFSPAITSMYAGNQANQTAAGIANANNSAALWGAGINGIGNAAGAYATYAGLQAGRNPAPACWVARAVYGAHNPKWLIFREWLLNEAPAILRSVYLRHGERFAAYIADKPRIKAVIRHLMDTVVIPRVANLGLQHA